MKLNEIALLENQHPGFLTDTDEIIAWVHSISNINQFQTISVMNGRVDFKGTIEATSGDIPGVKPSSLLPPHRKKLQYFRVKFFEVTADFRIWDNDLRSLEGSPIIVGGAFIISNNPNLKSLDYLPKKMQSLHIDGIGIFQENLIGIADALSQSTVKTLTTNFVGVKEGGIELITIPELSRLNQSDRKDNISGPHHLPEPFKIIEKYLGKPDDIYECQMKLIDAGFEEYAKL